MLLAVLLYPQKLKKVTARWGFGLWIIEAVSLALRAMSAVFLLYVGQEFVKACAPDSSHFQTLGSLFYASTQVSYSVLMVFYCFGGVLFYTLFLKSRYVPRVLSLWGIIAASLGFIGTLLEFFGCDVPLYVFLPLLPFELTIGVWLMVKGFNATPSAYPANTGVSEIS